MERLLIVLFCGLVFLGIIGCGMAKSGVVVQQKQQCQPCPPEDAYILVPGADNTIKIPKGYFELTLPNGQKYWKTEKEYQEWTQEMEK